jgi:hypothetical protein
LQWDAKFGISAPLWAGPRLKIDAVGELLVPMTRPDDTTVPSVVTPLNSRTLRFGVVMSF